MKKKPDMDREELLLLKSMQKAFEQNYCKEKDELDLFGLLVTAELRKLSCRNQRIAKHQIQYLLFNIQMNQEADSVDSYHSYNPAAAFHPSASITPTASNFIPVSYTPPACNAFSQGPLSSHIPSTSQNFPHSLSTTNLYAASSQGSSQH